MAKDQYYRWIKLGGYLLYIPLVLAGGPLAGYIMADFLQKRFFIPDIFKAVIILLGFVAGVLETVRLIRLAAKVIK